MNESQVELRFASRADAPALALMSRDLIEAGLGWSYRAPRVAELIRDPETISLVTHDHARIVGFAIMTFGAERAHLVLLAVRPSHRRRGVARRMMAWLVESAGVAGMSSIHVELRADNTAACAFYRSLGFAETFRVARYYRGVEAAVRMLRVLRPPGLLVPAWPPPPRMRS